MITTNFIVISKIFKCIAKFSNTSKNLEYATKLFSQIPNPSTFQFNTIIKTLSNAKSIQYFNQMRRNGVDADGYTFRFLFRALGMDGDEMQGRMVHGMFVKLFSQLDAFVGNCLIQMYVEFGSRGDAMRVFEVIEMKDVVSWTTVVSGAVRLGCLEDAQKLFDEMPSRNVVAWTSIIVGYSRAGRAKEAVQVFRDMVACDDVVPDTVAMVAVLTACAQLRDLELGRWLHEFVVEKNIIVNGYLSVALVDMYCKGGAIEAARRIFDSMDCKIRPVWNVMIDGYCKRGEVDVGRALFDVMDAPDIISFNSMITGYVQSSRLKDALLLFAKLREYDLQPDKFTLVSLLTACASLGALSQGKILHAFVEEGLVEDDIYLGTALLDMYAKCGKMSQALMVFNKMQKRDLLTWTAIISGFAMNGFGKEAIHHFSLMKAEGIRPNAVAYIGVLTACSHSGLLENSRMFFREMSESYNIKPEIEHYGCMVDLLGRLGRLDEAMEFIDTMPIKPNAVIWGSILSSCRVHKKVELAETASKHLLELEPQEDAVYVQLYNTYIQCNKWTAASKIRSLMDDRGIKKTAGYSTITISGQVHKFIAGDQTHPDIIDIQNMMVDMRIRLEQAGYSPLLSQLTIDVDAEEKEMALFSHSEKMAVAFGLLKMPTNLPIHIIKNLRVCDDCHSAIKLISKIWSREIIVRDRSRFHHFHSGYCSCNDFW